MKIKGLLMTVGALALLGACDGTSNRATPERLNSLADNGVDPARLAKLMDSFDGALARDNSISELNDRFGGELIDDPNNADLQALLQIALNRNADIGRAAQGINSADAQRLNAIFGYLPQLTLGYNQTTMDQSVVESDNAVFQEGTASYPVTTMTMQLRQPILDLERLFNIRAATAYRTRAEVEYLAVVQETIYRTIVAYIDIVQLQDRLRYLRRRIGLINEQIITEVNRTESGLSDDRTTRSLNAEKLRLTADIALAQSDYARGLSMLASITGASVMGVRTIGLPASVRGTERRLSAEAALATAVENNPDLIQLAVGVVEDDLRRKQAIAADFSPVIEAIIAMENEDRTASRFGGGSVTEDMSIGIQLTVPLFNRGGSGYQTLTSNVNLRNAIIDYHVVRRQLDTDITAALAELSQIASALRSIDEAIAEVDRNIDTEVALVQSGEAAPIQVALHRASKIRFEGEKSHAQMQYLKAWVRLRFLMGDLSVEAIQ